MSMDFDFGADPNIKMRSSHSQKYGGMGSIGSKVQGLGTSSSLQQPVIETIKRDAQLISSKIIQVFHIKGDDANIQHLRKNWDLWGPLLISLTMAALATLATSGDRQELFTNLFVIIWLGPFVVSANCRLLGANIALLQSVCLIIYCTAPLLILTVILFIIRLIIRSFLVNMLLAVLAVGLSIRGTKEYFKSLVSDEKRYLILYPVLLFYAFLGSYISMA